MNVVAIVQARMGSTRLPGKVLEDLGGKTMLARVVDRAGRSPLLDDVVVATTTSDDDDLVSAECERLGVATFRGPEQDVLERYQLAADRFDADVVVRITGDCPLIDPEEIDHVVRAFLDERPDYASNILERTLPRGLDTEAIARTALGVAHAEAGGPHERAHVTPFLYEHPERFDLLSVRSDVDVDHSDLRWTVDATEDLELVRELFARGAGEMGWREIARLFEEEPSLASINATVPQKTLRDE